MKKGIYINRGVEENGYISSIHHCIISNWELKSWFSLDVLNAKINHIEGGYIDYELKHSKELKKLLIESYIKAFKKFDYVLNPINVKSIFRHWFNPNKDETEDEHYVGIEYRLNFNHEIRESFHSHLVKKRIPQKNLSYVWIMKEYIIPNASYFFINEIKKMKKIEVDQILLHNKDSNSFIISSLITINSLLLYLEFSGRIQTPFIFVCFLYNSSNL